MFRSSSILLLTALLTASHAAAACEAYFPFDGDLIDSAGNRSDGTAFTMNNAEATPEFGEGRYGGALHLNGQYAVRTYVDLSPQFCPQVTFSAWIRVVSNDVRGRQWILSTGTGQAGGLRAESSTIVLRGSGNGLRQTNAIRDRNRWFFVAGVYDFTTSTYRLYWDGRTQEGRLHENPRAPENAFWLGAFNDDYADPAQDIYVDDLRIVPEALTDEQLTAIFRDGEFGSGGSTTSNGASRGGNLASSLPASPADAVLAGPQSTSDNPDDDASQEASPTAPVAAAPADDEPAAVEGGPRGGRGEETVSAVLRGMNFDREPTGDIRECSSFGEITADIAGAMRDGLLNAAAGGACQIQTLPLWQTRAALAVADEFGYETDEFRENLVAETYERCVNTASEARTFMDGMVQFWNNTVARDGWATIGPRELTVGSTQTGTLVVPGDRKFLSRSPVLDRASATLELVETGGRAGVNVRMCTASMFNHYRSLGSISINQTPDQRANEGQLFFQDLSSIRGQHLIIILDAEGIVGQTFGYDLKVD